MKYHSETIAIDSDAQGDGSEVSEGLGWRVLSSVGVDWDVGIDPGAMLYVAVQAHDGTDRDERLVSFAADGTVDLENRVEPGATFTFRVDGAGGALSPAVTLTLNSREV